MLGEPSSDAVCVVRRTFDAPCSLVYRAWTDPALVARWSWGRAFETVSIEMDCRAGGIYHQHIRDKKTGENWFFDGVFQEVVPGEKLVHTFHFHGDGGKDEGTSLVSMEFIDRGSTTEVVITNTQLRSDKLEGTRSGWDDVCDCVAECLASSTV